VGSFVVGVTIRVPRAPVPGENLVGSGLDLGAGGKGTNQAIGAARLGAQVQLLACLGDDLFAGMAEALYAKEGIDTAHIHRIPDASTSVGFVTLFPSGENTIVVDLGANLHMTPAHVDAFRPALEAADLVMLQLETPDAVTARTLTLCRAIGVPILLNPAPARALDPAWLPLAEIITPNQTEARLLLGLAPDDPTPTEELARRLLEQGARNVIITLGQAGALLATPSRFTSIPTPHVRAVDVTGAGDAFNAALAVGLAGGASLADAAHIAARAGAYATQHLGVIDGLPYASTDF
jgi:ribokinase